MSYINKLFPFLGDGDFVRNVLERKTLDEIFCPINFPKKDNENDTETAPVISEKNMYVPKAYHVLPCDIYVLNEREEVVRKVMGGDYGKNLDLNVIEIDYMPVAKRIEVSDNIASIHINGAYMQEEIETDVFINSAANGSKTLLELLDGIRIEPKSGVSFRDWVDGVKADGIKESADFLDGLLDATRKGKRLDANVSESGEDFVYS